MAMKHGHTSRKGGVSREYVSWQAMIGRCHRIYNDRYAEYGARGIKVCDRWLLPGGFSNFYADMGDRPENTTLDRIDNSLGYTSENCRWATYKEQRANQSPRIPIETKQEIIDLKGAGLSGRRVAAAYGVSHTYVSDVWNGRY